MNAAAPKPVVQVAVIGGGTCDEATAEVAARVGGELARANAAVVCGGLGGVMEAACRGAREEGGRTIGILPGDDRSAANPYVEVAVATGMGEARNALVVGNADAVIAVGGEYGTLSEVALALKRGVPVVGLHTWELARAGVSDSGIVVATTAKEAVELALRLANTRA